MATFNWSVPPFRTSPGEVWKTQCWGPVSKTDSCDQRSQDDLMCWGTFVTKYCNMVDSPRTQFYNPNNEAGPAATVVNFNPERLLPRSLTDDPGISNFAKERAGLITNECWKESFDSLGDGVVIGAGFPACINNKL